MRQRVSPNAESGELKTSDRRPVDKSSEARRFDRKVKRTKAVNLAGAPMRGGIRL